MNCHVLGWFIVLIKTPQAYWSWLKRLLLLHIWQKQFFSHTVKRKYVALVWGNLEQEEGTITGNIARHAQNRKMFTVYEEPEIGKHAINAL